MYEQAETTAHLSRREALCAALLLVAGCAGPVDAASGAGQAKVLRYQGWTGEVLFPELAEDLGYLGDLRLEWIGNTTSGPQDIQAAVTGDTDFGGAFNGSVTRLAAAGAPIKAVIGYYGTDRVTFGGYYVPATSPIRTVRDLVGKTVAVNTLGGHYEAVLRMNLARHGLTRRQIDSVHLVMVPPASTEQALRSGQLDVAVLNGMYRDKALARGGLRAIFTDYDLLGEFTAGSYVMRERFIRDNPDTVRTFVAGTARAIAWAQRHPRRQVIARFKQIIRQRGRNEDTTTVDYWKSTSVAHTGGVIQRKELSTWRDWLVRVGQLRPGAVDVADLYTNRFNPYAADSRSPARASRPRSSQGGTR